MNKKSLKSYGHRTDKAMKTVVRLEKASLKITNLTVNYLAKHNLTFNQFKVLEVLYHRGDLNIGSITKLTHKKALTINSKKFTARFEKIFASFGIDYTEIKN